MSALLIVEVALLGTAALWLRRTFLIWDAAVIVLIAGLGFFAARPAPLLGVDGDVIGNAVPHRGGGVFFELWPELGPCEKAGPGRWGCSLYDTEGSGGTFGYEVEVDRRGCWSAMPTRGPGYGRLSGCLSRRHGRMIDSWCGDPAQRCAPEPR